MRVAWLLLAGCGGGSVPDLMISMAVPITGSVNGGPSVFDPLIGHTIELEFVCSSMPYQHAEDLGTGCKTTEFTMTDSVRTAKGDQADLVQRELLDPVTNWRLDMQLCTGGESSTSRLAAGDLEHLEAWFVCELPDSAKLPDSAGYPRLGSFTSAACDATIDDISAQRNYTTATYSATFEVGPHYLP